MPPRNRPTHQCAISRESLERLLTEDYDTSRFFKIFLDNIRSNPSHPYLANNLVPDLRIGNTISFVTNHSNDGEPFSLQSLFRSLHVAKRIRRKAELAITNVYFNSNLLEFDEKIHDAIIQNASQGDELLQDDLFKYNDCTTIIEIIDFKNERLQSAHYPLPIEEGFPCLIRPLRLTYLRSREMVIASELNIPLQTPGGSQLEYSTNVPVTTTPRHSGVKLRLHSLPSIQVTLGRFPKFPIDVEQNTKYCILAYHRIYETCEIWTDFIKDFTNAVRVYFVIRPDSSREEISKAVSLASKNFIFVLVRVCPIYGQNYEQWLAQCSASERVIIDPSEYLEYPESHDSEPPEYDEF
jgi:hypothetical protein